MEIYLIDHCERSDELDGLVRFARGCSWQGTGAYFAECLEDMHSDINKVVAAYDDGKVIGFAALVSESCIENTAFTPWLDFLYVDEKYRNRGIAKSIVDYLLCSALSDGIEKVYLCTVSHEKMYEKFGFVTMYKTFINIEDECSVMEKRL